MRFLTILVFGFSAFLVNGQGNQFNKVYGENGFDTGQNIVQGSNDHYYIIGSTSSSSTGNTDILVLCIDENGDQIWAQYYGTAQTDIGTDLVVTADNNLLILGYTNGIGNGGYDCYLAKISLTGSMIWEKTYGGSDWDFAYDIQLHSSGNYYILGETYSLGAGNNDVYLIQIDEAGEIVWEKTYGSSGNELGRKMTIADNGDIIFIGDQKLVEETYSHAQIIRVDAEGYEIWEFVIAGSDSYDEIGQDVILNNDDYIALRYSPDIDGNQQSFILKLNDALEITWERDDAVGFIFNDLLVKNETNYIALGTKVENAHWIYFGLGDGFQDVANGGPSAFDVDFGYESFHNAINTSDGGFIAVGESDIDDQGQYSVLVTKFDSLLIAPAEVEVLGLPLGIEVLDNNVDFRLYPNPAINTVFIDSPDAVLGIHYTIKDIMGSIISEGQMKRKSLDIDDLSNGLYFVEFREKGILISAEKLIVKR